MPVAMLLTLGICVSATANPMTMIAAKTRRRIIRTRVMATGDSSPPATAALSRWPRRMRVRSTTCATTMATSTAATAATHSAVSTSAAV